VLVIAAFHPSPASAEALPFRCEYYATKAVQLGWPKKEKKMLMKIMWRESRCQTTSINRKDPYGGSFGLLQINGSNVGWAKREGYIKSRDDLTKRHQNLKVGLELWKLYGWRPWGTKSSQ
jgi:soluble lytic murein transglycosylase-like protein